MQISNSNLFQKSDTKKKAAKRREAFFALVADGETPIFLDVTSSLGKPMPFSKALATCGMRVSSDVVAFSFLQVTKRVAKSLSTGEVTMPRPMLARLERRVPHLELAESTLRVEALLETSNDIVDQDGPVVWDFNVVRDASGTVELEAVQEYDKVVMPKGAIKASFYVNAVGSDRKVAVSFIGHLPPRPGTSETAGRVASLMLNALTQLAEFRLLAGIEAVKVASRPGREWAPAPHDRLDAKIVMPVALFADTSSPTPLGRGEVTVALDLSNARDNLLFNIEASESIAEVFEAQYRPIVTQYVQNTVASELGPELARNVALDIMLNEVSEGTVERAMSGMARLANGVMFTRDMAAEMQ